MPRIEADVAGKSVVIVLSWFGKDDTLACVESIVNGSPDVHVLVVDNGSFDGVLEEASRRWPGIHVLQTGENLGFAGGMNAGLTAALNGGAAYVTVLNNDTIIPPGAIAALERTARTSRAVSPEVYYLGDPDRLWFGGGTVDPQSMLPHHSPREKLPPAADGLRPTTILAGCCVTAAADVWRRVGLFDERFFLNFEDSEWSLRARKAGVDLVVDTTVRILHTVSASFERSAGLLAGYYYTRNGLLFGRIAGGSPRARWLFLRQNVLPDLAARFRDDGWRDGLRALQAFGLAVLHYGIRRFGRAPRHWEARIGRSSLTR